MVDSNRYQLTFVSRTCGVQMPINRRQRTIAPFIVSRRPEESMCLTFRDLVNVSGLSQPPIGAARGLVPNKAMPPSSIRPLLPRIGTSPIAPNPR